MNLKVIGTGFGRTGSHSLKLALEMLGRGPCYHMMEVFAHPGHGAMWNELGKGERQDFETPLAGFNSTVDWPTTFFWRELMARNPDAKILHSERPPEEWYQSISNTILPSITRKPEERSTAFASHPEAAALGSMFKTIIIDGTFGGDLSKDNVIGVYERHNAQVRAATPKERLLVFNAREGWEPLCRFLGVAVPAEPYPKVNSTDEFRTRAGL